MEIKLGVLLREVPGPPRFSQSNYIVGLFLDLPPRLVAEESAGIIKRDLLPKM